MKILLKCPTRSRPQQVVATLTKYIQFANHPEQLGVAISCDTNDSSMTRNLVQEEIHRVLSPCAWKRIFFSDNHSKIEACNANMSEIDYEWDIVVLVSDDMIPQVKGYDDVIRNTMINKFPNTDGILWFNDGAQGTNLNTLSIYGRKMYEHLGYIYAPEYKSLFCDTELSDLCRTTLKDKTEYVSQVLIRHEHPGTGFAGKMDALYEFNQRFWSADLQVYIKRKAYPYDWSVLIPTIQGREDSYARLVSSIQEKVSRLYPELRYDINMDYDNRQVSVGVKRDRLLQAAKGKYMSFIDDDDEITDAYIEDLRATIEGNHHVMRLRGKIDWTTFTHSIDNKLTDPMVKDNVFVRPPNHLNPMMTDMAKFTRFKDATRGEDLEWTIRLASTGWLTNEYRSDHSRIHYNYNLGERKLHPSTLENQKKITYQSMLQSVWQPGSTQIATPVQSNTNKVLRLGRNGFVSV
jgi:hypothetical protein